MNSVRQLENAIRVQHNLLLIQAAIGGELKWTRTNNVPCLIVGNYYSVVYFVKRRIFKMFAAHGTHRNRLVGEFREADHIIKYLNKVEWLDEYQNRIP
jgi:hypothetical protein